MTGGTSGTADGDDFVREWELYRDTVDPIAREVVAAEDPSAAYGAANRVRDELVDDLTSLPHLGAVYVAWACLTDLFEIGSSTPLEAHRVLRKAANDWLARPSQPDSDWLEAWTAAALGSD